jgi:hypothetical protein
VDEEARRRIGSQRRMSDDVNGNDGDVGDAAFYHI